MLRTEGRRKSKATIVTIFVVGAAATLLFMAGSAQQGGEIAWQVQGSEHIEGCETGYHWVFSPGGGVTDVTLHVEINGTGLAPIAMTQSGGSGQGAWHADTPIVDTSEGVTPWVTFDGTAHAQAAVRISNCLDEAPANGDVPPENGDACVGPQSVVGEALDNPPRNAIGWDAFAGATGYNLYRATAGGEFSLLAQTNATTTNHVDEAVEPLTTYQYIVTAQVGEDETDRCDMVEVTAIPVFATVLAGALAVVLGVGAYAMVSRRA